MKGHGKVSRHLFAPLFPHWPEDEVPVGHGDYEGRTPAAIREEQPEWNLFRVSATNGEMPAHISERVDRHGVNP